MGLSWTSTAAALPTLRFALLVNPKSGRGGAPRRAAAVGERLRRLGHEVEACREDAPDQARRWLRERAARADRLLVAGGDGTLHFVVNALTAPPPIVVLPSGTANLLARRFHLPGRPATLARLALSPRTTAVDLARVRHLDPEGRPRECRSFLCAGFGYDGEIVRQVHQGRTGPIRMRDYLGPLAEVMRGYHPTPQEVVVDGRDEGAWVFGLASGLGVYGPGWWRLGPSRPDDGRWELHLFPRLTFGRFVRLVLAATGAALARLPEVQRRRFRSLHVSGPRPTPLEVDGDWVGTTPLDLELDGRRFVLVLPGP